MSLPIRTLTIPALLGTNEAQAPPLTQRWYSPADSLNLWADKTGRLRVIDGFIKRNAAKITLDTSGQDGYFNGLGIFKITSGIILVGVLTDEDNEWEIHTSADYGTTWTFRAQKTDAFTVLSKPDFAQWDESALIIAAGVVDGPLVMDGSLAVASIAASQIAAPTLSSGGVGVLFGGYKYRLVPVKSNQTRKYSSVMSAQFAASANQITLAWTADADTDVVGYEVYRTFANGEFFFYVGYSNGRTTVSYTDNVSDADLRARRALEEHGDAPAPCQFVEEHAGRMFYINSSTYGQRAAQYSDPGRYDSCYASNVLEAAPGDAGDSCVGCTGNVNGAMIWWLNRSVWRLSGDGRQLPGSFVRNWNLEKTNAQVGSVHHRTVVTIPAGAVYTDDSGTERKLERPTLAYLSSLCDIRLLLDEDRDVVISGPVTTTMKRVFESVANAGVSRAVIDAGRTEAVWTMPVDGGSKNSIRVAWNYTKGTWHVRDYGFSDLVSIPGVTSSLNKYSELLIGSEADIAKFGFVYNLWSGDLVAGNLGVSLSARLVTPPLYGLGPDDLSSPRLQNRWRRCTILCDFEQVASGVADTNLVKMKAYRAKSKRSDGAFATQTFSASVISPGAYTAQIRTTGGKYLHDPGVRIEIYDLPRNAVLDAIELDYQTLVGHKRTAHG